ncbi:MAG: ATP-dependent RecD-like DNA helicase [Lactobacillaceae bacterium]|jgi:exodeoxyribonuclease V alpha subunit|nr:ATP-dependent RecD-like DNA helicase [Lactobacillaceae bacterium]
MTDQLDIFGEQSETPTLIGQVQNIMFAAQDSFYKVLAVKIDELNFSFSEPEITVTGSFGDIQIGSSYEFKGKVTKHAKFGEQFNSNTYQRLAASSTSGLVKYLSSDAFTGIGGKTAEKIVDALGMDAIDLILTQPDRLDGLGLSPKQQATIVEQLIKSDGMERAIVALNDYGFGSALAAAIYTKYGAETLKTLKENPYQLVLDIDGVSFSRVDQLAAQQNMDPYDPRRINAGVVAAINQATFERGDTYIGVEELLQAAIKILTTTQHVPIELTLVKQAVLDLTTSGLIVAEGTKLYTSALYAAELEIAQQLVELNQSVGIFKREAAQAALSAVEKANPFPYDGLQQDAMMAALTNKLFILTGGPGTGKTTIINGVVQAYERLLEEDGTAKDDLKKMIHLVAPTGRAAKRLAESTGRQASTIHRLLGITGRESYSEMDVETISGQLLIVDEMSMVDTELFATLLRATPHNMQIILVGDKDQLPSVGPGRVFYDLLASGLLNFRELETIHRQGKGSTIVELAAEVKNGRLPANFMAQQPDRSFFPVHMDQVPTMIEKIVTSWINKGNSVRDMQILAPMYRYAAGVNNLNLIAQNLFNPMSPKKREMKWREGNFEFSFRVGDKVMQKANDPENNVFNGDIGYVSAIMFAKDKGNKDDMDFIEVEFDTGIVRYERGDFINLTLAYATTIHKAQGGEYALVIMPLVVQFNRMLQRNLLYTGLTRARESLVLLGEPNAYSRAVETEGANRQTTLGERISQAIVGVMPKPPEKVTAKMLDEVTQAPATNEPVMSQAAPASQEPSVPEQVATEALVDDNILTLTKILDNQIPADIGVENLTPYDFMEKQVDTSQ